MSNGGAGPAPGAQPLVLPSIYKTSPLFGFLFLSRDPLE